MTNDRLLNKLWLFERLEPLHLHSSLLTGLREEQITTTGPLSEGHILRTSAEFLQRLCNLPRRNHFLGSGKTWGRPRRRIDHVAAEEKDTFWLLLVVWLNRNHMNLKLLPTKPDKSTIDYPVLLITKIPSRIVTSTDVTHGSAETTRLSS